MKTYKINIGKMGLGDKLTLKRWSGKFTQITLPRLEAENTIFVPSENITVEGSSIVLGEKAPVTKKDLKWWGTLKQQLEVWEGKRKGGYYMQEIELSGTGYKFELEEGKLKIDIGKSHEYLLEVPSEIEFKQEKNMNKVLKGKSEDKQVLSQYLASIRGLFPLNNKGHGIVVGKLTYISP